MLCLRKVPPEKRVSQKLDTYLKKEDRKEQQLQKILLLGTGESGKTTILKQMKIIHLKGFSIEERRNEVNHIKRNVHQAIRQLVDNLIQNQSNETNEYKSQVSFKYLLENRIEHPEEYTQEYFDHVKTLWSDEAIKTLLSNSNKFQLLDNASYFLDRLDVIQEEDYIPTVEDILRCRVKTVGISKVEFRVAYKHRNVGFVMYDVGGQRGERRKWLSVFEGVTAILFIIATNDFDLQLREDTTKNRLVEAFKVFQDIFWSRFLRRSGKIVFLNKVDLLKEIVDRGHSIGNEFPEYYSYVNKHCKSEFDKTQSFIQDKILKIANTKPLPELTDCLPGVMIREEVPNQEVYIHFTVATNTNNIKVVFDTVKDIVLTNNLRTSGIY